MLHMTLVSFIPAETRATTKSQERRREVNEIRMLMRTCGVTKDEMRRLMRTCGVTKKDKIRNEIVRGSAKVAPGTKKMTETCQEKG